MRENVHLPGPAADRAVPLGDDLAVEERVEAVHAGQLVAGLAALHQHVHVKVDHLIIEPVEILERLEVMPRYALIERLRHQLGGRGGAQGLRNHALHLQSAISSLTRSRIQVDGVT